VNYTKHFLSVWSGLVFVVVFGIGWALIGGFVPPVQPSASAADVATFYQTNNMQKIAGLTIVMIAVTFLIPFMGMISVQMARIEGRWPIFAIFAAMCAVINVIYFVLPVFYWITVAFRPDQNPEIMRIFNDIAWIIIMWPFSTTVMQNVLFGIVVLSDKRKQPLFPRWAGFLAVYEAILILPGGLVPFFKTGAFAWNGILAFWLVASTYLLWIIVMCFLLHNSIKVVMREETAQGG
jgi:hypothetical protein